MSEHTTPERTTDPTDRLEDPATLAGRGGIRCTRETIQWDGPASEGVDGQVVVGVTNDGGELLVLLEDDRGTALLPHADVEPGEDWAAGAERGVEALTGIAVSLEAVEALRTVERVADDATATTYRVVYRATAVGGEILSCKRRAAAGSDGWRAAWVDALPEGVAAPGVSPRNDMRLFLDP